MNGTIVKIVQDQGYGFIKPATPGRDYFFHATGMKERLVFDELAVGDPVVFDLGEPAKEDDGRPPRAINVARPDEPAATE